MFKNLSIVILTLIALSSCDFTGEREKLRAKSDSLQSELMITMRAVNALEQVGALMDSIDESRNAIRLDMTEGLKYDEYVERMKSLNEYVRRSEERIANLEQDLRQAGGQRDAYANALARVKKEVQQKNQKIIELQELVEMYKSENTELLSLVAIKESELADAEIDIMQKKQELNLLESRIQEIMIQSKMTEADAYYARASAVEEAANRTKLAPKKKKNTYQEALDLYKRAKDLGREDAQTKIDELLDKI